MSCPVCSKVSQAELNDPSPEDITLTLGDLKDFRSSRAWVDIQSTLIASIVSLRDRLEGMGEAYDRNAISFTQGVTHGIRLVLNLPDLLEARIKDQMEESNESREISSSE